MSLPDILTPHLRLVATTVAMLQAEREDARRLVPLLAARLPPDWPPQDWEPHCLDFVERLIVEHPHAAGWTRYIVLADKPATVIGTVGGFPRGTSEVEIGYGVLPGWQRRGFATEAAAAFINYLQATHKPLQAVSAQTFPALVASIRVMERCGLRFCGAGDEEGTIRYRMDLPSPSDLGG